MGNYTNWTEEEFKAYLLIYASESNYEVTIEEKELIDFSFDEQIIDKIKSEVNNLNDYQKSQIIVEYIKLKKYDQNQLNKLLDEVKNMYEIDGQFDLYEQSIFNMLKKLLKV
tara:strand:+ start:4362 stop:4697 length:336 start_codon:yes stop_codon:yes gene_type:complete